MGRIGKSAFPNTGYFLPIIYGILGVPVKKLSDMGPVLDRAASLLPPRVKETHNLPYLGPALDAGMATFFAEECERGRPLPGRAELLPGGPRGSGRRQHLAGGRR